MFKFLLPIILIIVSVGIFIFFIDPNLRQVKELSLLNDSYNDALNNSKKLQAVRDDLKIKYQEFSENDLERLRRLLPDNVDNIRLIIEINDEIAAKHGMVLENVKFDNKKDNDSKSNFVSPTSEQSLISQDKDYGSFDLEFSVKGSYSEFISFLKDLEKSLRIVDISSVIFSSESGGVIPSGNKEAVYRYDFKIKTYWLKN